MQLEKNQDYDQDILLKTFLDSVYSRIQVNNKPSNQTFSKSQLNKIGKSIKESSVNFKESIQELHRYRQQHTDVIEMCKEEVCHLLKNLHYQIFSRVKVTDTIIDKLRRDTLDNRNKNTLKLSQMQDIAGIRLIFENEDDLYNASEILSNNSNPKKKTDYIEKPKPSGYRGIHIILCYEKNNYGYLIEVQLRTNLQHIWATTVEISDLLKLSNLKTEPSETDNNWNQFYHNLSILFSRLEKISPAGLIQDDNRKDQFVKANKKLCDNLTELVLKLADFTSLLKFEIEMSKIDNTQGNSIEYYFVLINTNTLKLEYFEKSINQERMLAFYNEIESLNLQNYKVFLFSSYPKNSIVYGYPNYLGNSFKLADILKQCNIQLP